MIRSRGHCNTMGTASSDEHHGRGSRHDHSRHRPAPRRPDSRLLEGAHASGRLAVELVRQGRTISQVITQRVVPQRDRRARRCRRVDQRRRASAGHRGAPRDRPRASTTSTASGAGVPLLVNLQPAGEYLMEDLYRAGGVLAVLAAGRRTCSIRQPITVTGRDARARPSADHPVWDTEVITPRDEPLQADAGIAVLRGNLAPRRRHREARRGQRPTLLVHRGPAVVFDSVEDLHGAHRRPGPARHPGLGARAARLRPAGLPGHAGGGQPAAAEEDAANRAFATWCGSATDG